MINIQLVNDNILNVIYYENLNKSGVRYLFASIVLSKPLPLLIAPTYNIHIRHILIEFLHIHT